MAKITLQYSIVNETAVDAVPVEANFARIEAHINQEVIERGGTVAMTAPLKLFGAPVAADDAASKSYVDGMQPIGFIGMYGGTTDPTGGVWLVCDGRSLEAATYPSLFAVLGTSFGGSGGNFNIPDMRDRMPMGVGPSDAIGSSGGTRDTIVPTHSHTITHTHVTALSGVGTVDHSHAFGGTTATENQAHDHAVHGTLHTGSGITAENLGLAGDDSEYGGMVSTGNEQQAHNHNFSGNTGGISANHQHYVDVPGFSGSSGTTGVAVTNQNLPPYRTVNFIIKAR